MAPTATRRSKNCNRQREVVRESSLKSSMLSPCSHICSNSNDDSSHRNSTTTADKEEDHNNPMPGEVLRTCCSTPKGRRFRISADILTCPPAPMKPRVAPKLLTRRSSSITFFAPQDIELFFFLAFQNVSA